MTTILLFILALRIIFVTSAEPAADPQPSVICNYLGMKEDAEYFLVIAEIPARCGAVSLGTYQLDVGPSAEDIDTIAQLVAQSITVYMTLASPSWTDMMNSAKYDTEIGLMTAFMNDNKISGFIMDIKDLYASNVTTGSLKALLTKMKPSGSTYKVGILIPGDDYGSFVDKTRIDYSLLTDPKMDLYIIDSGAAGVPCDAGSSQSGRLPKTGTGGATGLNNMVDAVKKSGMSPVLMNFKIHVSTVAGGKTTSITYASYCDLVNQNKLDPNTIYCADTSNMFYDQVQIIKPVFTGILLSTLNNDAHNGSCGKCGTFPVANAYINGFEQKPIDCVVK